MLTKKLPVCLWFLLLSLVSFPGSFKPIAQATKSNTKDQNKTNRDDDYSREILFQSLPSNFEYNGVRCILKDYKGYMWFGTDDGLIRFDGINQYVYEYAADDSSSLSHNSIIALEEDNNHNLWVGTAAGLNLYDRERDEFILAGNFFEALSRLNNTYISALYVDDANKLWIGSFGYGLHTFDLNKEIMRHYPAAEDDPSTVSSNRITCLVQDHKRNMWIGTQQGLNLFSNQTWQFSTIHDDYSNSSALINSSISSLELDSTGNIWVGSFGGGLTKITYENEGFSFSYYTEDSYPGRLSTNNVLTLAVDQKGYLWIGTENGGLNRLNIQADWVDVFQKQEGNQFSLNSNSIWEVYSDDQNRIWIGTYNSGINVIDEKYRKFASYYANNYNKDGLPDNDVTGFTTDETDNIWIATDGGGVCKFYPNSGHFRPLNHITGEIQPIENTNIQTLLNDYTGSLWMGSWGDGVYRLDNNKIIQVPYTRSEDQNVGKKNIFNLFEDQQHNVWAGTAGNGLFKYNASKEFFEPISFAGHSSILTSRAYVTSLAQDSSGLLWVGTLNGLVQLKSNLESGYTVTDLSGTDNYSKLSSRSINVLFIDSKENLWVGTTDNGLNLMMNDKDTIIRLSRNDGLPSNSIRAITEDLDGNMWITTNRGVVKLITDSMEIITYTTEDGLNSNEFYSRSILRTASGHIYAGGEEGFNVIVPGEIKKNATIPPVDLTGIKINNKSVKISDKDTPLKKHISETEKIVLTHVQSSFTLDFVALNYTRPTRNRFKYKLEGFDEDWKEAGNTHTATYTNIRPGEYVFMVKGANNDGVWNENPTQLQIIIKPPFWKTWWAILGYVLLTITVVFIILRAWNERIRIKNELKLEKLAREREHELNESNIQFFTDISHEFRTPLSLIIAPLESLKNKVSPEIKDRLTLIYKNAGRLLHLTNTLMDIRKLETGNTRLRVQKGDVFGFIREAASYFKVNAPKDTISFELNLPNKKVDGWYDPEKLETILINLLSNAFKFTRGMGYVRLSALLETGARMKEKHPDRLSFLPDDFKYLKVTISDNGIGIPEEELPRVFDKFYRTKSIEAGKNMGTGVGLALVKGLVELMNGSIWVTSKENDGTHFTFVLPVDKKAFQEDEFATQPIKREVANIESELKDTNSEQFVSDDSKPSIEEEKYEILVVEDNEELRSFLKNELQETYLVSEAENGRVGLELALENTPDLIISDILMPFMNGMELCHAIKTDVRTSHIPVIMLTAKTTMQDQVEGIEIGADVYLTKPFNISLLKAHINNLIHSRQKLYAHFSQDVYLMPNQVSGKEMDQQFMQKCINYIVEHMGESNLSVEDLASALNLSRSNVYRKIKALTGKTIVEFIRTIRLKQAIKLMETKNYSLAEIAYQTGFTSPSYFTKLFKEKYGKPPSEYAREN